MVSFEYCLLKRKYAWQQTLQAIINLYFNERLPDFCFIPNIFKHYRALFPLLHGLIETQRGSREIKTIMQTPELSQRFS